MTAFMLLKAICKYLEQCMDEYAAAQGNKGEYRKPRVFPFYLPFKNPKVPEKIDFPYITVRIESGQDPDEQDGYTTLSTVQVILSFGVYHQSDPDNDGFIHPDGALDLLNLMEYVRISLQRQGVIDRKYRIEKPYTWRIPEEQPYPLWVGQATTTWTIQSVTEQFEEVFLHG